MDWIGRDEGLSPIQAQIGRGIGIAVQVSGIAITACCVMHNRAWLRGCDFLSADPFVFRDAHCYKVGLPAQRNNELAQFIPLEEAHIFPYFTPEAGLGDINHVTPVE